MMSDVLQLEARMETFDAIGLTTTDGLWMEF